MYCVCCKYINICEDTHPYLPVHHMPVVAVLQRAKQHEGEGAHLPLREDRPQLQTVEQRAAVDALQHRVEVIRLFVEGESTYYVGVAEHRQDVHFFPDL